MFMLRLSQYVKVQPQCKFLFLEVLAVELSSRTYFQCIHGKNVSLYVWYRVKTKAMNLKQLLGSFFGWFQCLLNCFQERTESELSI